MVIKTVLLGTILSVLTIPIIGQPKTDSLKQLLTASAEDQKFTIYRALFDEYLHTHPDSSLHFLNKGFLELEHPSYEDSGYYSLLNGNYHASTGEIEASKQYYINAIRHFRNSPDTSLMLKPMKNLGAILFYQGNIDTAIHIQENAFRYYKAAEDWQECAYTKNNIGVFYKTQGKFLLAIENYKTAATYFERIGLQEGLSTIYNNIGSLYVEMDRPDVAKDYFQRALDVKLENRSAQDMGRLLLNMGIVLNDLGDPDSSMLLLKRAKSLFLGSKDSIQLAHCHNEIGSVYLDRNEVSSAVGHFRKAVRMAKSIGDPQYSIPCPLV